MRTSAITLALVLLSSPFAQAQKGVTRASKVKVAPHQLKNWEPAVRYSVLTDFADNRTPRSYVHSVMASLTYNINKNWSFDSVIGGRAETIGGQISKSREQTYDETLGPSTSFALSYSDSFRMRYNYAIYIDAEPLWDEASRQEGYKGIIGIGSKVSLSFLQKYYTMTHDLSVSELLNSYTYGSNALANPDYFYTYKLANIFKIYRGFRASYTFGTKVTRYMDDFIGYSYSNSFSLSHAWPNTTVALTYENGGFTDDGEISLWYLDEYRRLARFVVGYTF